MAGTFVTDSPRTGSLGTIEVADLDPRTNHLEPSRDRIRKTELFSLPPSGTDKLSFRTWDLIGIDGFGEEEIEFSGHYTIERGTPTALDWVTGGIDIRMVELAVSGESGRFGRITASISPDPDRRSQGSVSPGTVYGSWDSAKWCNMYGYMVFDLIDLGVSVENREPIHLQHKITHIPPIGQGGGTIGRVNIGLYVRGESDSAPRAHLRQVRTHIGAWIP